MRIPYILPTEIVPFDNMVFTREKEFYKNEINTSIREEIDTRDFFLTTSCTAALEMTALVIGVQEGDQVVFPDYTYVGTINPFVKLGADPVLVDIDPIGLHMDISLIEKAINEKTKAVVIVHYAGNPAPVFEAREMVDYYSNKFGKRIFLIEDAAQAFLSRTQNVSLGTVGDLGCFSFDHAKNIQCGQGGICVVNDKQLLAKAEIIYNNGTNKLDLINRKADKFEWLEVGSNFSMSEYLYPALLTQLDKKKEIQLDREKKIATYRETLNKWLHHDSFTPDILGSNRHLFYIIIPDAMNFIQYMRENNIETTKHYNLLHNTVVGQKFKYINSGNSVTNNIDDKIVRLPNYYNLSSDNLEIIIKNINTYFKKYTLIKS